jgi:hypothetical protein
MTGTKNSPVPMKIVRAMRQLIDLELYDRRAQERARYSSISGDIAYWLGIPAAEMTPLHLVRDGPPPWCRSPELVFLWSRGHQALRARRAEFDRRSA